MNSDFFATLEARKNLIDEVIEDYFLQLELPVAFGTQELKKSMEYSSLRGGKRFRPVLCLLLAEAFGVGPQRVLPMACAIELIHTYSLIHDDLPCMDNDDMRRGEPTNHKVFSETTALLAGDALLTEAFVLLAHAYESEPHIAIQLVGLLAKAAGAQGMVGGQAIDLKAKTEKINLDHLLQMHGMKTGALIRVAAEGAAVACGLPEEKIKLARDFGADLGLAFQIADDVLDSKDSEIEAASFPGVLGFDKTHEFLAQVSDRCLQSLAKMGIAEGPLAALVKYNQTREK